MSASPKRKRGRPAVPDKAETFTVRMRPKTRAKLKAGADRLETTEGKLISRLIEEHL